MGAYLFVYFGGLLAAPVPILFLCLILGNKNLAYLIWSFSLFLFKILYFASYLKVHIVENKKRYFNNVENVY